jgi:hypothetical protein
LQHESNAMETFVTVMHSVLKNWVEYPGNIYLFATEKRNLIDEQINQQNYLFMQIDFMKS